MDGVERWFLPSALYYGYCITPFATFHPFTVPLCSGMREGLGRVLLHHSRENTLYSNPLLSIVLNFLLRKIPLWIYPLWIWTPTVDIFIKFHWIWFSYMYMESIHLWGDFLIGEGGGLGMNAWKRKLVDWLYCLRHKTPCHFLHWSGAWKQPSRYQQSIPSLVAMCEQMLGFSILAFIRLVLIMWPYSFLLSEKCK